jgi:TonB family protein
MGYQALLFCPDEKLANVVTQVFNELDFTVEAAREPFAAVKKLMAQHYDALVVDSENDQNASLLFKSARNSSFNQSSLAIALVEGQIGVAKAYRIGANLVLTKPINVEQAKGTLRVARGLLRKHSDTGVPGAAMAAAASPAQSPAPVNATPRQPATAASPHHSPPGESELATPAVLASAALSAEYAKHFPTEFAGEFPELNPASGKENRGSVLIPPGSTATPVTASPAVEAQRGIASPRAQTAVANEPTIRGTASLAAQSAPSQPTRSVPTAYAGSSHAGSATAPAPAKEPTPTSATKNRIVEVEPESGDSSLATVSRIDLSHSANAPSFAALDDPDAAQSGSGKRILIAAIVLALAVLGYFGYAKFGTSRAVTPATQPANAPPDSSKPAPTTLQPMSAPDQPPAKSNSTLASQSSKTAPDSSGKATPGASAPNAAMRATENTAADPAISVTKSDAAPMLVKTATAAHNAQPKTGDKVNQRGSNKDDESEPLLALASANDGKLAGLMSGVSSTVSKPTLATLKISQGVSQGLLIKRVTPAYPKTALAARLEGEVLIEATINRDGNVTNAKVLSGTQVLAQAALDAVRQWRYKPYYLDGTPVDIQTQITVKFKAH